MHKLKVTFVGLAVVVEAAVLSLGLAAPTPAGEPGTIGLGFGQLYSDAQANKRGPLVVLQVLDGLPGDKAGLKKGDVVVSISGLEVAGRELADIIRNEIHGPVGGTVRFKVVTPERAESEITLTRVPYPPHTSQAGDPFAYSIPGSWRADPRYAFPLPWAPALSYTGTEDLAFSPNFDDAASPEYHSYAFFWWLDGNQVFSTERLGADMTEYFRGLAQERGSTYKFTPDLGKVSAKYDDDRGGPRLFGGEAARAFRGQVAIYDTRGKVITMNSEVIVSFCQASGHTAAFFALSLEPPDSEIWKSLRAIRESLRCSR